MRHVLRRLAPASRARVLLVLFALLVPSFIVTAAATQAFRAARERMAAEWQARGEVRLRAGRVDAAAEAMRVALSLSREDRGHRLRLAQVLAMAGHGAEARAHLLTLRERAPGDGTINLELARLAAADEDVDAASDYYRDAIEGSWRMDAERRRSTIRLERADFLLRHGATAAAQAELVVLADDLPPDPAQRQRVGELLLASGDARRALTVFRRLLEAAPEDAQALAGAGEAALGLRSYGVARRYLARAASIRPGDARVQDRLATASARLALDPFARGLSAAERGQRAAAAWRVADARLTACLAALPPALSAPGEDDLQQLALARDRLAGGTDRRTLARNADVRDQLMALAFRVEEVAAQRCGPARGADLALLLMAGEQGGVDR